MNILSKVTWKAMWKNKTRTIVTIIGVILSAALFMAVTTAVNSIWNYIIRGEMYYTGNYFLQYEGATDEQFEAARKDPGFAHVADMQIMGFYHRGDEPDPIGSVVFAAVDDTFLDIMSIPLIEGRMPENSSEIVIPECMTDAVGEPLMLAISPAYTDMTIAFEKTYTVVGVAKTRFFNDLSGGALPHRTILTYADGDQGQCQSHRVFAKTRSLYTLFVYEQKNYGQAVFQNTEVLSMYAMSDNYNRDKMILGLALILCGIIMAVSISLISNAFSIAVSERTRQFGLLSSIGATKKQIRKSVRFEAFSIGVFGIPLGVLLGYSVIALLLETFKSVLMSMFTFSEEFGVELYPIFSWSAALVAVAVCSMTIFLSVLRPSKRATKVTPMEAIRQSDEFRIDKHPEKAGRIARKLFGLPGLLAAKNYKVSRRKYRATVVSLAISFVLFVTAGQFAAGLTMISNADQVEDFDLSCAVTGENRNDVIEQLRNNKGVEESALLYVHSVHGIVHDDALTGNYIASHANQEDMIESDWNREDVRLAYLEDSIFVEHLRLSGVDPAPYFDPDNPTALTVIQTFDVVYEENGETVTRTFYGSPLRDGIKELSLFSYELPEKLKIPGTMTAQAVSLYGEPLIMVYEQIHKDNGTVEIVENSKRFYLVEPTKEMDGYLTVCNYYAYDLETNSKGKEVLATNSVFIPDIQIGTCLEERPFGISVNDGSGITLILPLSAAPDELISAGEMNLQLKTSDYTVVMDEINACKEKADIYVIDHAAGHRDLRGMLQLLRWFATGFLTLICTICMTSVFNTITTSIALRRRDFGMLRSIGLRNRDVYRMMAVECLSFGSNVLLLGVPISLLTAFVCYKVLSLSYYLEFSLPWGSLAIGGGSIFAVVFISMYYAVSKLRKDNPIDAIRMENT